MPAAFVGTGFEIGPRVEGMKKPAVFMREKKILTPLKALSRFSFGQKINFTVLTHKVVGCRVQESRFKSDIKTALKEL